MLFYGRIVIPSHFLSSESRNSKVFTHSHMFTLCQHLGVSALTGKKLKGDKDFAIKEHHLFCHHSSGFYDFSILDNNNNDFKVNLMESLLINRDDPPLNKNRHSLPLELSDD